MLSPQQPSPMAKDDKAKARGARTRGREEKEGAVERGESHPLSRMVRAAVRRGLS